MSKIDWSLFTNNPSLRQDWPNEKQFAEIKKYLEVSINPSFFSQKLSEEFLKNWNGD